MTQLEFNFDEQTDDLGGFPTIDPSFDGRADALALQPSRFTQKLPPCTGYEADYERTDAFFRSFN